MSTLRNIIIVGAGPAGLTLALLLAKTGINVQVLEQASAPTNETRAVFYQPVSLFEFERAGILDDVLQSALHPRSVSVRDIQGSKLFGLPRGNQVALMVNELAAIIQEHIDRQPTASILWGHRVVDVGEADGKAWVEVQNSEELLRFEADYVVGCDGGQSTVRRLVFGEKAMPGFTWDKNIVAADVVYDFAEFPDIDDSNLFIDSQKAFILFRPSRKERQWRVVYQEETGLSDDESIARSEKTLKVLLPGHPDRDQYEIDRIRPYRIHQRLVESMRKGRFLLASDAAHLCCPYGALGLNGGIADVGSLYDCLVAIHEGKASASILDTYSSVRREKWNTIIDPQSQGMLKTIFSDPSEIIPNHPMYKMSMMFESDPAKAAQSMPDPLALRYDFSAHYQKD